MYKKENNVTEDTLVYTYTHSYTLPFSPLLAPPEYKQADLRTELPALFSGC